MNMLRLFSMLLSGKPYGKRNKMARSGLCPICRQHKTLTKHHIYKSCVWRSKPETQTKIFYVCRKCHDAIEIEITRRENVILTMYPDLYEGVVDDFVSGKLKPPKKRGRRRK